MMRRRDDSAPVPPQPWAALVPADSFYARLAGWRDALVDDASDAPRSKGSRKGRPSIPPSLVVLTMLLQHHDDCADAEAEARLRLDLRWEHALGLSLEDGGFDAAVLRRSRRKLLDHGLERALFERLVNAAREAGLLVKDAEQAVDRGHIPGAAGARDTCALIRGGIRKLLRALGYAGERRAPPGERLAWYVGPGTPEKPELDWSEAAERAEHLRALVADARAALALVTPEATGAAAREAAALLAKIVADGVEEGPPPGAKRRGRPPKPAPPPEGAGPAAPGGHSPGERAASDAAPRLRRGTAPDRVLSVADPELRVGHKSPSRHRAGYKAHCCEEPTSELIAAVEVRPANEHAAVPVVRLVTGQRATVGLRPSALLADGAYGAADARAAPGALGVEVVAKLRPLDRAGHVGKDDFAIDLAANDGRGSRGPSGCCPGGVTTAERRTARDGRGRPVPEFVSPLAACAACPLAARRPGGPAGRVAHPVRPCGRRAAPRPRGGAPGRAGRPAHPAAAPRPARAPAPPGQDRTQARGSAPPAGYPLAGAAARPLRRSPQDRPPSRPDGRHGQHQASHAAGGR